MILERKKTAVKAAVTGVSNRSVSLSQPIVLGEWGTDLHFVHSDIPRTDHQSKGSARTQHLRLPETVRCLDVRAA
jgi:hypothetical protein